MGDRSLLTLLPNSVQSPSILIFLFRPHHPLRPKNLVRRDSGWSRSWARCRALRLSRSPHSCLWTWGPAGACSVHLAGAGLPREADSRRRPGPRSYRCQGEEGSEKGGKVLMAGLEKTPEKKWQQFFTNAKKTTTILIGWRSHANFNRLDQIYTYFKSLNLTFYFRFFHDTAVIWANNDANNAEQVQKPELWWWIHITSTTNRLSFGPRHVDERMESKTNMEDNVIVLLLSFMLFSLFEWRKQ